MQPGSSFVHLIVYKIIVKMEFKIHSIWVR
jgi:hypothetical protein